LLRRRILPSRRERRHDARSFMTVLTDFLATHQLLTILIVLASGALLAKSSSAR